ncbi:MAG: hypothetical protein ABSG53_16510, partial [Thermoguttaceae bacterium]
MPILDGFRSLLRRICSFFSATPVNNTAAYPRATLGTNRAQCLHGRGASSWVHSRNWTGGLFAAIFRKPSASLAREAVFPGLFIRELEQRRVLSASSITLQELGKTLVIGAGLQAENGTPDTFEVMRQGDTLKVSVNGQTTATAQLEQISAIKLQAATDQDTFLLNFSGGNIAPSGGIQISGVQGPHGSQDTLVLQGGSVGVPIGGVAQQSDGIGSGFIRVAMGGSPGGASSSGAATIEYAGIGSIENEMQAQHVTLEDTAPGDALAVTGNAAMGDFTVTSSHGAATTFATPPSGLTLQAGAGSTVDFSGITDLRGGNLTVSAGSIRVDGTLISHGGAIDLDAGAQGTVLVSGSIDVSNTVSGRLGGSVELLGDRVGLLDRAVVDASGNAGGGSVLIGGDYHGANAAILDASFTYVGPEAQISAGAIAQGDGGHVVVWSNVATQFLGNISARGGNLGGNGGSVEVSSGQYLDFGGRVDGAAPAGGLGTLLLDPHNITVQTGGAAAYSQVDAFNFAPASDFTLDPATLAAVTGNVVLQANNDITVTNAITLTTPGQTLTLQAGRSILVNADITTNDGAIRLTANETVANGVVDADR